MRIQAVAVIVVISGSLVAADRPAKDVREAELNKLQGEWKLVAGEEKGRFVGDQGLKQRTANSTLTISGNKFKLVGAYQGKTQIQEGLLKVDPSVEPKTMDWYAVILKNGKEFAPIPDRKGIYEINGDVLRFGSAIPGRGSERPKELKTTPDRTGQLVLTFKRAKP
jgi:uncharacterized protein (TIGR03067 family)